MSEIPNFPNYLIYRDGSVWSKKRSKYLKHFLRGHYKSIGFKIDGKNKFMLLHRLLAITFIPNPENKPCVDHIDRNKLNNNLDNLRWVTYTENNCNKVVSGKIKERYITMTKNNRFQISITRHYKTLFIKSSKNWTLEQAVNVRNIVLKFLKFSREVD